MKRIPPVAYFITFRCYGTLFHGEGTSSVDQLHNQTFTPFLEKNPQRVNYEKRKMQETPYLLDAHRRQVVLETLIEACQYRHWKLYTAHVRSNHVHCVVSHPIPPEKILTVFKSRSSRMLKEKFSDDARTRFWSDHGSTRYLFSEHELYHTMRYVIEEQGEKMAYFLNPNLTGTLV